MLLQTFNPDLLDQAQDLKMSPIQACGGMVVVVVMEGGGGWGDGGGTPYIFPCEVLC